MGVLGQVKNGDEQFGNFMQPMARLSMHSTCLDFSFVLNMFPSSSQWVPIRFSICSLGSLCVPQGCSQQHLALSPYVAYLKHVPKVTITYLTLNPLPHSQKKLLKQTCMIQTFSQTNNPRTKLKT
jgi:hypothetical protein